MSNKWSSPQIDALASMYIGNPNRKTIEEFCAQNDKSYRQAVSKLVHLGLYVKEKTYLSKNGLPPVFKAELIMELEELLGFGAGELTGIEGMTKPALQALLDEVRKLVNYCNNN